MNTALISGRCVLGFCSLQQEYMNGFDKQDIYKEKRAWKKSLRWLCFLVVDVVYAAEAERSRRTSRSEAEQAELQGVREEFNLKI